MDINKKIEKLRELTYSLKITEVNKILYKCKIAELKQIEKIQNKEIKERVAFNEQLTKMEEELKKQKLTKEEERRQKLLILQSGAANELLAMSDIKLNKLVAEVLRIKTQS